MSRQMLLMRDTSISFPELWLNIHVVGPPMDTQGFAEMFARGRCFKADTPDKADLVVFTGGPDVDPRFYTEAPIHDSVFVDESRDDSDLAVYTKCYDDGIPMFGVCRGAQFGHVMNGGKLFMDVDKHQSQHLMYTETEAVPVSSLHHQLCIENDDMDVIGWAEESTERYYSATSSNTGKAKDVEAFFYRDTCFFGVQGHPEYKGYLSFTHWCLQQIEHLIVNNPDIVLNKDLGVYRLKPEFLKERDSRPAEDKEVA